MLPFDKRSEDEARKMGAKGGKKSGETRRKKANFRRTLNALLTAKIDSPEWEPLLSELGVDCTLESALNMAMIKQGLNGDVKAYTAIVGVLKTEEELKHKTNELQKQNIEIEKQKTEIEKQKMEIEKQRLEIEKMKLQLHGNEMEEYESDGFMEALKAVAKESISEGVDFIET